MTAALTAAALALCTALTGLTVVGVARATRPAETPQPSIRLDRRRLEDPEVVAGRLVDDLASKLCRAGASPYAAYVEGGRRLFVHQEEVYGDTVWTISVLGALVGIAPDLPALRIGIAQVVRGWRERDAAKRLERDVRGGA